ncbi:MAG: hypothetical protein JWQ34_931 [Mucilaginibacter sp.]|nr:hypothetical protein [Mucilaginibacter sp.]
MSLKSTGYGIQANEFVNKVISKFENIDYDDTRLTVTK